MTQSLFNLGKQIGLTAALLGFLFPVSGFGQLQPVNLQASDSVDAIAIVVTPDGPYPAVIEHLSKPFVLFVVNRSGILSQTFSLVIKPVAASGNSTTSSTSASTAIPPAASLLDLHSTDTKQRDSQLVFPIPGSYQLRFSGQPDWVVDIKITN